MAVLLTNNPNTTFPFLPYCAAKMSRGITPDQCENDSKENQLALLMRLVSWGHLSVFEHTIFTFHLSGVSRICLDQLNRYRHSSICMESGREVDLSGRGIIIPESVQNSPRKDEVLTKLKELNALYSLLIAEGIPLEDARYIIPMGTEAQEIFTLNMRELFLVRQQRLCSHAQWEIRELVDEISSQLLIACPELKPFIDHFGPPCQTCTMKCKF